METKAEWTCPHCTVTEKHEHPVDAANEPVDFDDGIVDTGVLHEEK